MELTQKQIRSFQNMIFSWWHMNRRDLPWRRTRDPYKIFISEMMLQQTQVSRVLPVYQKFIKEFPDFYVLAHASPARILTSWKGMGYNRRALFIHKTAKIITESYHGKLPQDISLLQALPGIGPYTAAAIAVFACKKQMAVVDTNIRHIITHFFYRDSAQTPSIILQTAKNLLPDGKAWEWHQALMDYGALELKKHINRQPKTPVVVPFRQSKRFFRGRIIDTLREGPVIRTAYMNELEHTYNKSSMFFQDIIAALVREGMVMEHPSGILALPTE